VRATADLPAPEVVSGTPSTPSSSRPSTPAEVRRIVMTSPIKSCSLDPVPVVESARHLGVLNSRLTLSAHVTVLCRARYHQLRQLHPLVLSMTAAAARTVAATLISCRLDYCNSLHYGLPGNLLRKLQSVQNATARLITGT